MQYGVYMRVGTWPRSQRGDRDLVSKRCCPRRSPIRRPVVRSKHTHTHIHPSSSKLKQTLMAGPFVSHPPSEHDVLSIVLAKKKKRESWPRSASRGGRDAYKGDACACVHRAVHVLFPLLLHAVSDRYNAVSGPRR